MYIYIYVYIVYIVYILYILYILYMCGLSCGYMYVNVHMHMHMYVDTCCGYMHLSIYIYKYIDRCVPSAIYNAVNNISISNRCSWGWCSKIGAGGWSKNLHLSVFYEIGICWVTVFLKGFLGYWLYASLTLGRWGCHCRDGECASRKGGSSRLASLLASNL